MRFDGTTQPFYGRLATDDDFIATGWWIRHRAAGPPQQKKTEESHYINLTHNQKQRLGESLHTA